MIELGIPFSDPTAEGPVIQEANVRALSGGVTTDKIFDMVVKIRRSSSVPMVFMTYANVVFLMGQSVFKKAAETGMDGLILPDVPFEEKAEFDPICKKYGLDLISLIAPTSQERITQIARGGRGLCLLCIFSWSNRNAYTDYHRYQSNGEAGKGREGYSLRRWLWYFQS